MIDPELFISDLYHHGFHIIDGFLEPSLCHLLRSTAQNMHVQGLFRSAKIGVKLTSQQNNMIRTDEIHWIHENETSSAVSFFLNEIHQLAQIINQSLFLSLHEFETHFAIYQPGTFYRKHSDQFARQKTRKISYVYYLNRDWKIEYGGELKLYSQEDQFLRAVLPQENRFICFNSELPHEVCLTHQPRYSITGWMKTRSMSLVF